MIQVSIKGEQEILAALSSAFKQIEAKVDEAIQGAGIDTEAEAKQRCPVDTGRLRASIKYTPAPLRCTIGTNVTYAHFVELGTRKRSAHPYLYPAFQVASKTLKGELRKL
jgi:HK97 gp10 family phage protein